MGAVIKAVYAALREPVTLKGADGGEHQALGGITATARPMPGGASSEAICFAAAGAHARKGEGLGLGRAVTQGRMSVRC